MNLISFENSWTDIRTTIANKLLNDNISYLNFRNTLCNNCPKNEFNIDSFDYSTDSLYFLQRETTVPINLIFSNSSVEIGKYTFDFTGNKNVFFNFDSTELNNLVISDMYSLIHGTSFIIVPENTKDDYINLFDNCTDSENVWGQLSSQQKEEKILEVDEYATSE